MDQSPASSSQLQDQPATPPLLVSGCGAIGSRFGDLATLLAQLTSPTETTEAPPSASSLALAAAKAAWQEAEGAKRLASANVGVIVGSSRTIGEVAATARSTPVQELVYSSPVALAGEIARQLRCTGPCLATSSACASGVAAMALAADMLTAGSCDAVIVGAVDLATAPETARRFARNGLCAPGGAEAGSRPFDAESPGIHLGDGAAFLVLERRAPTETMSTDKVYLTGWAQRSQPQDRCGLKVATSLLRPCLEHALARANLSPEDLSFLYTHGNGNPRSDANELDALTQFFATNSPVPLVATKHLTGHCLGATSAIEAAVTVRVLEESLPLPTFNLPSLTSPASPIVNSRHASIHAFGLWGSCAAVVFSRGWDN